MTGLLSLDASKITLRLCLRYMLGLYAYDVGLFLGLHYSGYSASVCGRSEKLLMRRASGRKMLVYNYTDY